MNKTKVLSTIILMVLVLSLTANVFLIINIRSLGKKNRDLEQSINLNTKVIDFTKMFISKVLKAKDEVIFEDRLAIENAVRDTKDKDIYDEWQKFVGSKTDEEGRENIKDLLQLLISKISQ